MEELVLLNAKIRARMIAPTIAATVALVVVPVLRHQIHAAAVVHLVPAVVQEDVVLRVAAGVLELPNLQDVHHVRRIAPMDVLTPVIRHAQGLAIQLVQAIAPVVVVRDVPVVVVLRVAEGVLELPSQAVVQVVAQHVLVIVQVDAIPHVQVVAGLAVHPGVVQHVQQLVKMIARVIAITHA